MKKPTWIEENNNLLAPLGLCVGSYNGQHKVMRTASSNKPVDYFAGVIVWRSDKRAQIDAWIDGALFHQYEEKERTNQLRVNISIAKKWLDEGLALPLEEQDAKLIAYYQGWLISLEKSLKAFYLREEGEK